MTYNGAFYYVFKCNKFEGNWILGFNKFFEVCLDLKVEFWGIFKDVSLLLKQRLDKVNISTNCLEAVQITQDNISRDSNSALVRHIHQLLERPIQ